MPVAGQKNDGHMILTLHFYAFRRLRYSWWWFVRK